MPSEDLTSFQALVSSINLMYLLISSLFIQKKNLLISSMKSLVCLSSNSSVCVRINPSILHIHLSYELYDYFCIIYVYFDPERQGPCLFLTLIEGRKVTNYKPILAKILRQHLQMSVISRSIHRRLYLLTQQNTYSM
jgi:hypothetical protein